MITKTGSESLSSLDSRLFVSLRPFRSEMDDVWHDPVDPYVANVIPAATSIRDQVLPFQRSGGCIFIAAVDPLSSAAISLSELMEGRVIYCRVELEDLIHAQDRVYGLLPSPAANRLGDYFIASGRVSEESLAAALAQQHSTDNGARLGAILIENGLVNYWDVAEAVAKQRGLPLIDLLKGNDATALLSEPGLSDAWSLMDERFWFRHLVVPLSLDDTVMTVAMVDVDDQEAIQRLESITQRRIRVFVTGYRDVMSVLTERFRSEHEEQSRMSLHQRRPEDSALKQLSRAQLVTLICMITVIVVGFLVDSVFTGVVLAGIIEVLYAATSIFRLWAMVRVAGDKSEIIVTEADLKGVPPTSLPEYTVLVPMFRESAVLPTLTNAIKNLRYPKDRLDVKLLLEEDDDETILAAESAGLPAYMEIVKVPRSEPRTKPKACNYGLTKARGEYLVIFDAEDIPEPDQLLKAVTVFRQSETEDLACVQAKLSYFNQNQNILTKWFTAEYANWFELLLPSLFTLKMPVPLGGSSNHFRTEILRSLGAWDPFNVTEDADLGVRLHKAGYRTAVMNSITFEEANSDFVNWIRQRSRWIKGYMQTWLVHMRNPVRLWKELGVMGFVGFQLTIGGTFLQFLVNPLMWAITLIWIISTPVYFTEVFSGWIYYVGNVCLFLGNIAFAYANLIGVLKSKQWSLVKWAVLSPVYWIFMSIAAFKAIHQLAVAPSYWEKTVHGLAPKSSHYVIPTEGAFTHEV